MAEETHRRFSIEQLDHVALTVSDLKRSIAWYCDLLGFERRHEEAWGDTPAMLYSGSTAIALFAADTPHPADAPSARTTLIVRHIAFRVSRNHFDAARHDLESRGIAVEFQDHTISHSIYFRDPDNYEIELTTYDVAAQPRAEHGRHAEPVRTLRLRLPRS